MTRMDPGTFRLILLVSCAHAMVHTFEHALPAVEQMIGEEFKVGTEETGRLGTVWRLPFGLAAMLAGWLADRYGSRRMLVVYLLGCSGMAVLAWWAPSLAILFGVMFGMGCFASIYHPAGLSLISRETTPETRGAALGWHGIFGSIGIAGAPFLAASVFHYEFVGWRGYFVVLIAPALVIAGLLTVSVRRSAKAAMFDVEPKTESDLEPVREAIPWKTFLILVVAGALSGFVYAAFLHFLPRYLDTAGIRPDDWSRESFRNALTTIALLCAAVGQAVAGRIAKPGRLEKQLTWVFLANVPPLLWMAAADGVSRFIAACLLAFIHFMNQPIYNSLVAQIVPASRRSLGYGFSNMVCFGIGALGPYVVGTLPDDRLRYGTLGILAALAGVCAAGLLLRGHPPAQHE